jgi:hypothetical protein
MTRGRGNAFLIAAATLPLAVVALFLVASAVPRWTVAPPAHDLVLAVDQPYAPGAPRVIYEFAVRDGQVVATPRPVPTDDRYPPRTTLWLFDHAASTVHEVSVVAAAGDPEGDANTVVVAELAGRHALPGGTAPDGYTFDRDDGRGAGLVGEIFGMGRSRQAFRVIKDGRVVPLDLPVRFPQDVRPVAWLGGEAGR